jgi:hypothetical protein
VEDGVPVVPIWLRAIGVLALAAIGGAMGYAVAIGIANFSRIGV